jgi:transcriptional regulator of arginine metabolism
MPSKYEMQERRREAIRKILMTSDPPVEDQKELLARLKEMGIPATQSSLSRDLAEMGVLRVTGHYELPSWFDEKSPFRSARGLVVKMLRIEQSQLLLTTLPGAGHFVAEAIEASEWEYVLATLSGYSSVLVFTENEFYQDVAARQITHYLREDNEKQAAKPDERPGNT